MTLLSSECCMSRLPQLSRQSSSLRLRTPGWVGGHSHTMLTTTCRSLHMRHATCPSRALTMGVCCEAEAMQAPAAERRPKQLSTHNDVRSDPYYWLRDDEREDPAVSGLCSEGSSSAPAAMLTKQALSQACSMTCVQTSEQRSCRVCRCLRT